MNLEPFYKQKQIYSITINPMDNYQFYFKKNRYCRFRSFMYETLLKWMGEYTMYIEISEPRGFQKQGYAGPRLHLHGTFQFKSPHEIGYFLLYMYPSLCKIGTVDIDTVKDPKVWLKYCTKQHIWRDNILSYENMLKESFE